jgi:adenine-specific DNA-methyltransferase
MDSKSLDITAEKLAQLRALFPEVFSEDKVDFARLKDILGENIVFPNEHYELSWAGKAEARKEIQRQTTSTLIPDKQGSINFGETENLFIEGENLEVLRVLQKSYFGQIKMIYIDPPYNTGNDSFVYPDDYAERLDEYNKRTGKTDEEGYLNKQDLWHKNTRDNGQFHSVWLSMMYPRLYLARNLLKEDGIIFVSIDDNEQANLKLVMNEVFGEENDIGTIIWKKKHAYGRGDTFIIPQTEYIFCYAKDAKQTSEFGLSYSKDRIAEFQYEDSRGKYRLLRLWHTSPRGAYARPTLQYELQTPDRRIVDSVTGQWLWSKSRMESELAKDNVVFVDQHDGTVRAFKKDHLQDGRTEKPTSLFDKATTDDATKDFNALLPQVGETLFTKPAKLIKHLINSIGSTDDEIILDFFAGSGTTAQAVIELNEDSKNRKFICVQLPELLEETSEAYKAGYRSIADIGKARIQKVVEKLQAFRANELLLEAKGPLGFNSFKIASSNFKAWRGDIESEQLLEQLEIFQESQKVGSHAENMLYELLLKSGLPLTSKIETVEIGMQQAYIIENNILLAFFESYDQVIRDFIREQSPKHVICLDSVFAGKDEDLSNFKLELSEAGIELTII